MNLYKQTFKNDSVTVTRLMFSCPTFLKYSFSKKLDRTSDNPNFISYTATWIGWIMSLYAVYSSVNRLMKHIAVSWNSKSEIKINKWQPNDNNFHYNLYGIWYMLIDFIQCDLFFYHDRLYLVSRRT